MSQTANNLESYIWSLADLLRGDFRQSQYGRIILPFTLLRRLECVFEGGKKEVLAEYEKLKAQNLPEEVIGRFLAKTAGDISYTQTAPQGSMYI